MGLTKSETVLDHVGPAMEDVWGEGQEYFGRDTEEASTTHPNSIVIPTQMWVDMGKPGKLTISLIPGDSLNE